MQHTYTINNMIFFDSILGTLESVQGDEEVIYLNNPVSRCLQLLIERQGQVIPHEDFLYYVWEQYGLNVSINNFDFL
ncbi:winged helix-turn-helix domain-containing protein [Vibrio sp.]|uniref:winged helix-turn-helix domain-containing protein n=1 Tax=Vibrio sp. TaxID=678 RepID=UPI003AA7DB41